MVVLHHLGEQQQGNRTRVQYSFSLRVSLSLPLSLPETKSLCEALAAEKRAT